MSARNNDPWTVQKRFGFGDEDLKTSKHDDIIFWVGENIVDVVNECFNITDNPEWTEDEIKNVKYDFDRFKGDTSTWYEFRRKYENVEFHQIAIPSKNKTPEVSRLIFEYVIQNKGYTIGFVDIFVALLRPYLSIDIENGLKCALQENSYALEIKGHVESFGQLLRQIRLYQEYLKVPFAVVAPDDKFKKMLNSQGIGFAKYPYK